MFLIRYADRSVRLSAKTMIVSDTSLPAHNRLQNMANNIKCLRAAHAHACHTNRWQTFLRSIYPETITHFSFRPHTTERRTHHKYNSTAQPQKYEIEIIFRLHPKCISRPACQMPMPNDDDFFSSQFDGSIIVLVYAFRLCVCVQWSV